MLPRNVCSYAATTRSFKFMILITFKSRGKTYSEIKKKWFLLVHWVAKIVKINEKIQKQLSGGVL